MNEGERARARSAAIALGTNPATREVDGGCHQGPGRRDRNFMLRQWRTAPDCTGVF